MAEEAAQRLALPAGLLELCALLGASREGLRRPEQVRPDWETEAATAEAGPGATLLGVCGAGGAPAAGLAGSLPARGRSPALCGVRAQRPRVPRALSPGSCAPRAPTR